MLELNLSATDELPPLKLSFQHSLVSLSKWESKHEKPFYGLEPKNEEETAEYIKTMLLTEDPPANWYDRLGIEEFRKIADYINSKQSATTFGTESKPSNSTEIVTSELIYYWMVQFQIPFQPCESWHLSRLMVLIKIAGIKQSKPKPMSAQARAEHYRRLNEQRRKETGSSG